MIIFLVIKWIVIVRLLLLLLAVTIIIIYGIYLIYDWIYHNKYFYSKKKSKKTSHVKEIFHEEINEKSKEYIDCSKLWMDKKWIEENLIDKVISWKQYESFSNVPGIYIISIIDGKYKRYYIGKSKNVIQRITFHIYNSQQESTKYSQYITNAIKYQGIEKTNWRVLSNWDLKQYINDSNLNDILNKEEKKYIQLYKEKYGIKKFYNQDEGGIDY